MSPQLPRSWIWKYDAPNKPPNSRFHRDSKGRDAWKCRLCWEFRSPQTRYYARSGGTGGAQSHLKNKHKIRKPLDPENEDTADDEEAPANAAINHPGSIAMSFRSQYQAKRPRITKLEDVETDHLNSLFLDLITDCQLPFRFCEKQSFQALVAYLNPCAEGLLPISHNTVACYIMERYNTKKDSVRALLKTSISRIHVSCDGWTSGNSGTAYLGITARFATRKGRQQLVLAMKELHGAHSGFNMAEVMLEVIEDFRIEKTLGFCNADNAANNDTMCRQMEEDLEANGIDWSAKLYRIRCAGHISNLAVQALLFGKHPYTDSDPELPSADDIQAWRKLGSLGKLHNIIIWIYHSPQRRKFFQILSEGTALKRDNKTRWTSWYEAIMRALTLRDPLDLWGLKIQADKDIKPKDKPPLLTDEDWATLRTFSEILEPYKEVTLATEGYGDSLNVTLIGMDLLLDHLESAKLAHKDNAIFTAAIETSWDILEKYYTLTDDSPAYATAIILDPRWKWTYFNRHWTAPIQLKCMEKAKTAVNSPSFAFALLILKGGRLLD